MTADKLIFIFMLVTAVYVVSCRNYKRIIIALGAFSLIASFCYLLYHAPDVAIAEAVIGSALSTILYIVALKKHRTFYIYFTDNSKEQKSDYKIRLDMEYVVKKIMNYCTEQDLEAQVVFSRETPQSIAEKHLFDLILINNDSKVTVYGTDTELHAAAIKNLLLGNFDSDKVSFVALSGNKEVEETA